MSNKKKGSKAKPIEAKRPYRIEIEWDGHEGEGQAFKMLFQPDLSLRDTDVRKHLVLLANAFSVGVKQLVSLIKALPQPTEQELKDQTYDFGLHGEEYGEGLFELYNYKKAVMEEFVSIVERVLPDAFHDILFVKGAQEKIFEQMRTKYLKDNDETVLVEELEGDN